MAWSEEYTGFRSLHRRHQEGKEWFPLDNAAKIFPSVQGTRYTTLFRLAAVLDHPVRLPQLERALQRVMQRYPYFQLEIRRGAFWYYLDRLENPPRVMADGRSPCMRYRMRTRGAYLLRVRAYRRRIAIEFCHVLTDGTGAATFLRSLVTEYFSQCGVSIPDWGDIPRPGDEPSPQEFRDAHQIIDIERFPTPPVRSVAFHVDGEMLPRHEYGVVTGLVSSAQLKEHCRGYGVSITEYLVALLFLTYQDYIHARPEQEQRRLMRHPIRILVPVNLRPFYATKTRRNFFVYVDPEIDLRLGTYDFDELVHKVHNYMRGEVNRKNLNRHLSRNVSSERKWFVRIIPLRIKDIILRLVYQFGTDRQNTTSFSNLGRVQFPPQIDERIEWVEFIPPPSPVTKMSAAIVSHGDTMAISFGSLLQETEVQRRFFRHLRRLGLHVKIETNLGSRRARDREEPCHTVQNAE